MPGGIQGKTVPTAGQAAFANVGEPNSSRSGDPGPCACEATTMDERIHLIQIGNGMAVSLAVGTLLALTACYCAPPNGTARAKGVGSSHPSNGRSK
ncbi:MAG: hypothetical protein ACSLFJ_03030 [Immundisolibacter sp.]|uniref:hypothetical protein n=1 Tax=Immundisolibacter sp. TaxID=1934948 RepID=UPI003EDEA1A1